MAKRRRQRLPAPVSAPRVETGAVQFGDDWPGLFLRGDQCMALAASIRSLVETAGSDRLAMAPMGSLGAIARCLETIERDVIVTRSPKASGA